MEENTTCRYAVQDKAWLTGHGHERWELYTDPTDSRPDLEGQTSGEVDCDQTFPPARP